MAIPLLAAIDIGGKTITADALLCQREVTSPPAKPGASEECEPLKAA
jgi:predicted transposase YbfD/YdcC